MKITIIGMSGAAIPVRTLDGAPLTLAQAIAVARNLPRLRHPNGVDGPTVYADERCVWGHAFSRSDMDDTRLSCAYGSVSMEANAWTSVITRMNDGVESVWPVLRSDFSRSADEAWRRSRAESKARSVARGIEFARRMARHPVAQ
jgi:hypothetical protein